jgi:hypothetical protein
MPFIMGVHGSLKSRTAHIVDVIAVDLDFGSVFVPEHIAVPSLPEPYYSRLLQSLQLVNLSSRIGRNGHYFRY